MPEGLRTRKVLITSVAMRGAALGNQVAFFLGGWDLRNAEVVDSYISELGGGEFHFYAPQTCQVAVAVTGCDDAAAWVVPI